MLSTKFNPTLIRKSAAHLTLDVTTKSPVRLPIRVTTNIAGKHPTSYRNMMKTCAWSVVVVGGAVLTAAAATHRNATASFMEHHIEAISAVGTGVTCSGIVTALTQFSHQIYSKTEDIIRAEEERGQTVSRTPKNLYRYQKAAATEIFIEGGFKKLLTGGGRNRFLAIAISMSTLLLAKDATDRYIDKQKLDLSPDSRRRWVTVGSTAAEGVVRSFGIPAIFPTANLPPTPKNILTVGTRVMPVGWITRLAFMLIADETKHIGNPTPDLVRDHHIDQPLKIDEIDISVANTTEEPNTKAVETAFSTSTATHEDLLATAKKAGAFVMCLSALFINEKASMERRDGSSIKTSLVRGIKAAPSAAVNVPLQIREIIFSVAIINLSHLRTFLEDHIQNLANAIRDSAPPPRPVTGTAIESPKAEKRMPLDHPALSNKGF